MNSFNLYLFRAKNLYSEPEISVVDGLKQQEISENDYTYLEIHSDVKLNTLDCFVWITDYKFRLQFEEQIQNKYVYSLQLSNFFSYGDLEKFSKKFRIREENKIFYKLFLNHYGVCEFELENDLTIQTIGSINVISTKINEIENLLDYLFQKNFFYWNAISLTKLEANETTQDKKNILLLLNQVKRIIDTVNSKFVPSLFDTINRLVPKHTITQFNESSLISEDSLLWVLQNTDKLQQETSGSDNVFFLLNRKFTTEQILSQSLINDTDVVENQILHGFVNDINLFLMELIHSIKKNLDKLSNDISFISELYKFYFDRLEKFAYKLQDQLFQIKYEFDKQIPVKQEHLLINSDNKFHSKEHYYLVYVELINWLEKDDANILPDSMFTGTKDISKLYEIFCLFKIIDTINELGFIQLDNINFDTNQYTPISMLMEDSTNLLPTIFHFSNKEKLKLSLFYEVLPTDLTTVAKGIRRGYRPDFIIEIIKDNKKAYMILDAKYKRNNTIEKYDYEELSLKYLHGIASTNNNITPIIGLFILNPIENSNIDFYQKTNSLADGFKNFPIIGRVEMSTSGKNVNFGKLIKQLLDEYLNVY